MKVESLDPRFLISDDSSHPVICTDEISVIIPHERIIEFVLKNGKSFHWEYNVMTRTKQEYRFIQESLNKQLIS